MAGHAETRADPDGRIPAWLHSGWLWFSLSAPLGAASVGVVKWASRTKLPPTGCIGPAARVAAWNAAAGHINHLVWVAERLGIAGFVVAALGIVVSRNRGYVTLYVLPYILVVASAAAIGHGLSDSPCTP